MQQLECVTFNLSYNDVLIGSAPYEGVLGKCNTARTDITWNNFNIGELLKDYGDYEYFNLRLSCVMLQNLNSWATDTTMNNVKYMLSGFDFVHQSYDILTQSEMMEVPICPNSETSEQHNLYQNLAHTIRFKKGLSNNIIRLRLRIVRSVYDNSNETVAISGLHPRLHMTFNIYPIE